MPLLPLEILLLDFVLCVISPSSSLRRLRFVLNSGPAPN